MNVNSLSEILSESTFNTWLQSVLEVKSIQIINQLPWRLDCLIETGQTPAYLKLVTPDKWEALKLNLCMARFFGDSVPEIVAYSDEFRAQIIRKPDAIVFGQQPSEKQSIELLKTYASLQMHSLSMPDLLNTIGHVNIDTLLVELLDFLNPQNEKIDGVNAGFYMHDVREAQGYHAAITSRADLIQQILQVAATLPAVLNHCQLDPMGVYEKYSGAIVIDSWEYACSGPAGLSLHRLFGSCSSVLKILMEQDQQSRDGKLLFTYVDMLLRNNYSDSQTLSSALPAAAFVGVMRHLVSLSKIGFQDFDYCKQISRVIKNSIEDLVHYCDELVLHSGRDSVLYYTNDYVVNGAPWRGASLLERWLEDHPADVESASALLNINLNMANWEQSINSANRVLALKPGDPEIHNLRGIAYLKKGEPNNALKDFQTVERFNPQMPELNENLVKCSQIISWMDKARIPHLAPELALTDLERDQQTVTSEKIDLAVRMYREYGYTVIRNVFDKTKIAQISQIVFERYNSYFEDRFYEDNLILGDKRRMVTLDIEGVFNDPGIYGNPIIDGMMSALLNDDYVMGGFNSVVSLPGSKDQGLHKDYAPLFPNDSEEYFVTPSFASAVLIPLIKMSYSHGVTSFRKGSHKVPEQMPFHMDTQEPLVDLGDCVVFDYRVAHEGLANHTTDVRPMLSMIYHRIWFRDALNYEQQVPVSISRAELEKVPAHLKHLFKWVEPC